MLLGGGEPNRSGCLLASDARSYDQVVSVLPHRDHLAGTTGVHVEGLSSDRVPHTHWITPAVLGCCTQQRQHAPGAAGQIAAQ